MSDLVRMVARVLLIPAWAAAAAVLVRGYGDHGDGFSAGVIAATALVLQVVAFGRERALELLPFGRMAVIAAAGLGAMLLVVLAPLLGGLPPLSHQPAPGAHVTKLGMLELHTAVLFDLGMALTVVGMVAGAFAALAAATTEERERDEP